MRFYDYKAQSITSEVHGSIEAKDKKTAAKILNVQGLKVIKIVQQKRFQRKNILGLYKTVNDIN